jgi:hypothetical protein
MIPMIAETLIFGRKFALKTVHPIAVQRRVASHALVDPDAWSDENTLKLKVV